MLVPAFRYADQILNKMMNMIYSEDVFLLSNGTDAFIPEFPDEPRGNKYQFASVDEERNLIGYIEFCVDRYISSAYNFAMISFNKGNYTFGRDMHKIVDMIENEFHLHRMEWCVVCGNPAEKSYDRLCRKYSGNKYIYHDSVRDRSGKYRNNAVYEIIFAKDN